MSTTSFACRIRWRDISTLSRVEGYLDQVVAELRPSLDDHEALLARFDSLSTDQPEVEAGPQRMGSVRDLKRGNLLGKWAGAYLHAFRSDYRVFPYVEVERTF